MTPERFQKIKNVLDKRQTDLTIVMDNVHKPHNLAAIIRSCDAIGIGHIHGISKNHDKVGVNLKAASGSNHWVRLHTHTNKIKLFTNLKDQGHTIFAANNSAKAIDFRTADFTNASTIILGAELDGVSDEIIELSDQEINFLLKDSEAKEIITVETKHAYDGNYNLISPKRLNQSISKNELYSSKATANEPAFMVYTSGTTSRPKMVPLSQKNLLASARNISKTLNLNENDKCLNIMPMFHIHGLIAAILAPIYKSGTIITPSGFDALKFFRWLNDFKPTWYTAVPTMHQAILARAPRNIDIIKNNQLKFIRSSSASLPATVMEKLEDTFNTCVIESYGMTEATHQMTSNPLPPNKRKAGSVGLAAGPEVALLLDDKILHNIKENQNITGQIIIKGENVTEGYINNPEANSESYIDGWFLTGDEGVFDNDGYLKITGRLKEIINRGGEKISPKEIDEIFDIEAKFVNPKVVTNVPGPGAHEPNDIYTTKEHSKQFWSINRIDKDKGNKAVKHPGPTEYNIPSKIIPVSLSHFFLS